MASKRYITDIWLNPGLNRSKYLESFKMQEEFLKQRYRKHILYVKNTVPKENLLIWQVKDGWKPLCDFLKMPVPEGPIPHDNRTGDLKFMDDFSVNVKITQDGLRKIRIRFRIRRISQSATEL